MSRNVDLWKRTACWRMTRFRASSYAFVLGSDPRDWWLMSTQPRLGHDLAGSDATSWAKAPGHSKIHFFTGKTSTPKKVRESWIKATSAGFPTSKPLTRKDRCTSASPSDRSEERGPRLMAPKNLNDHPVVGTPGSKPPTNGKEILRNQHKYEKPMWFSH